MTVKHITKADFDESIKSDKILAIDFSAEWCPPCKVMGPIFENLSNDKELSSLDFLEVNVDNEQELSQKFNVTSIPTFVVLKTDGEGGYKEVERFMGVQDPLTFRSVLEKYA